MDWSGKAHDCTQRVLSIQQKFRLKLQKFHVPNIHSCCTVPTQATAHLFIVHINCQQDTEEQYWGQQFCQMERDILVWPAKITRLVKVDHLQTWSQIFWSEWTEWSSLAFYFYKPKLVECYGKLIVIRWKVTKVISWLFMSILVYLTSLHLKMPYI